MLTLVMKMRGNVELSSSLNFGLSDYRDVTVRELVEKFIKCWGEWKYEIYK